MFENKLLDMKKIIFYRNCLVFIITIFLLTCHDINGQFKISRLDKNGKSLLIYSKEDTIELKNILIPEVNAHYKIGCDNNFYIIYEYDASINKSMITYSICIINKELLINKVIQFNYDDKVGVPFGWIYYCNEITTPEKINYDALTNINSQMEYDSLVINNNSCSVKIINNSNQAYLSKGTIDKNKIIMNIPLFFKDGTNIGIGQFDFYAKKWNDLRMSFPIDSLCNYKFFYEVSKIDINNIRSFNDFAYYLEQSHSYYEAKTILNSLIKIAPSRTVAYINLGDAYWGLKESDKAKTAYQKYIELMKASGKESKIPQRVFDRVK